MEEHPRPFIQHVAIGKNVNGAGKGRLWIHCEGNINGMICFTQNMFKTQMALNFLPYIGPFAIRDVANKYAPDEFFIKHPNDLVCRKHQAKTAGIVCRRQGKYCIMYFGLNRYSCPSQDLLRNEGLRACCLKEHCKSVIPKVIDFLYEVAQRVLELNEQYKEIDKLVELINDGLQEYQKKTFRIEVNNRDADCEKDGTLWCPQCPNALIKGYLNGELYDKKSTLYDNIATSTDTSDPEIQKVYKLLKEKKEKEKKK